MIVFNKKITSNSKSVIKINCFGINSTSLFYFIITFYISVLPFCNLQSQEIIQLLNANWKFSEAGKNDWLPATVPGTVHTDLLTNKRIPDPFIGTNESKVQWVESKQWNYTTTFNVDEKLWKCKNKIIIVEGLDTYADVKLNDSLILQSENMFLESRIDVGKYLRKNENKLEITFHPASELIEKNKNKSRYKNLPGGDRAFIRKAQYQFGWDWGPRLVTCGIWKAVRIEGTNELTISNLVLQTDSVKRDTAFLSINGHSSLNFNSGIIFEIYADGIKYSAVNYAKPTNNYFHIEFKIPHPKLWWCNGMGKANLYNFTLNFKYKEEIIIRKVRSGIRTIQLDQTPSKNGTSFTFKLNNKPIFIKGANWIPCDNFLPRVTSKKYNTLLTAVQESNMNMLRVWGGGVYEDDRFYNLCDSLGIMVWQDFMFACALYPPVLLPTVTIEIENTIKRLQSHPCITVWCGNNEIDEGWNNWGWQKEFNYSESDSAQIWNNYEQLFKILIPEILYTNCKEIPYVTTSPATGWGRMQAYQTGDVHYWGVWWGNEPFSSFDNHVGRFVSEYGFQALPSLSSFNLFNPDENNSLTSTVVKAHQKHPTGFETITNYMERDYSVPNVFSDYVYVSQIMQRDGIAKAIKAHRRAMPYCMGTLFWQFNDCWPVTSWSTIDYYEQPKILQYELKFLYAPVLISAIENEDSLYIYIINDDTIQHTGKLICKWMSFDNEQLINTEDISQHTIAEGTKIVASEIFKNKLFKVLKPETGVLNINFNFENGMSATENYYFKNTKSLVLPKNPKLTITITPVNTKQGIYTISLYTEQLSKDVFLSIDDSSTKFNANGFDLLPGTTKEITMTTSLSLMEVKKRITYQSMNNIK